MALTHAERSAISKKAWRERKRKEGKAICYFCKHAILVGGVAYGAYRTPFHKGCLESARFGLTRKQAGVANPRRGPFPLRRNPDLQAHLAEYKHLVLLVLQDRQRGGSGEYFSHRAGQEETNLIKMGMTKEQIKEIDRDILSSFPSRNPRGLRDAYRFYGAEELNPRPPARWWAKMFPQVAAGYPRRAKESLKKWREDISRILGGIWWKMPEATRERLIRKYD